VLSIFSFSLVLIGYSTLREGICGKPDFAFAEGYPTKPIRIIVPYPPGGFNDNLARTLGQKLTEKWGQPVIVDNRPGGGSTIGTNLAAKSAPDGYTLLIV
jgi:tripartite-type tricarboxylate transporter receptor subunit TctC